MTVRLLRAARINHKAGEIVEVSPAEFEHLVSLGSAEAVTTEEKKPKAAKKKG